MFGMECVADDVETWDCEAIGLVGLVSPEDKWRQCDGSLPVTVWCDVLLLQPLNVELHDAQGRTYSLKAEVGVIGGVLPGFVAGIHKDSVRS